MPTAAPPGWPAGPHLPGHRLPGQLARFIAVGVTSTVAYVLLYLLLRSVMAALPANAVSLLVTAIGNTAANRRVTFGIRRRHGAVQHQARGLVAFGSGLALTSGALAALHAVTAQPARVTEVTVLVAANLIATLVRFGLYRGWVFHGWRDSPPARSGVPPARVPILETAPVQSAPRWDGDPR